MALRTRRSRRQKPVKYRLHKPEWIDPNPGIPGTEPEKRVFAILKGLGIYFIYQGQVPEFEPGGPMYTMAPPEYKPDFVLPEYRLIIDPFSPFHHSREKAVQRDVRKVAVYNAAGYAYYHPWAVGGNDWVWDQYHDSRKQIVTRVRGKVTARIRLYEGVNAQTNSYRNIDRRLEGAKMDTLAMLLSIPELRAGPRYKLKDPRDIKAKQSPGYRIGKYLGAGASSVAAANRSRGTKRYSPAPFSIRVRR